MFDGIDVLTLPADDLTPLLALYGEGFGFTPVEDTVVGDPAWQQVWCLPLPPTRTVLLARPGSAGGWIRLVEVPGLPPATPARRADRVGPFALDFYLRPAEAVEARIAAAGWRFRSDAVRYPLPGTATEVRERMLEQPVSGLVHAMVEHRPGQTRCVLDRDPAADASEVVACVVVTDRYEEAAAFAEEVLGARRYFEGDFAGPAVERMLGWDSGDVLRAALFRGPGSRNARLEFARCTAVAGTVPPAEPVPRVVAGCAVADLDELAARLADGRHGEITGIRELRDGEGRCVHRLGLASRYGLPFEFWQRGEA